jgi:hypothetical protein
MNNWRSRVAFPLLAYAFTAIMIGTTLPTPMYALYSAKMHFSVLTTTVVFATYAGGVLAALLVMGRWSDVVGRRPMLLLGAAFALASALVFLAADTVDLLLIGRVLSGLSAGVYVGTVHRRGHRGGATGLARSGRRGRDDRQHWRSGPRAADRRSAGAVCAGPAAGVIHCAHRADGARRRRGVDRAGDVGTPRPHRESWAKHPFSGRATPVTEASPTRPITCGHIAGVRMTAAAMATRASTMGAIAWVRIFGLA